MVRLVIIAALFTFATTGCLDDSSYSPATEDVGVIGDAADQPDADQPDADQPDADQPDADQPDADQPDGDGSVTPDAMADGDAGHEPVTACAEGFRLTASATPAGSGTVEVDPVGGGDDPECYTEGTQVTVVGVPAEGFVFKHWEGETRDELEVSGGVILMDTDKAVRAAFESAEAVESECAEGLARLKISAVHQEADGEHVGEAAEFTVDPAGDPSIPPEEGTSCYVADAVVGLHFEANPGFTFDRIRGPGRDAASGVYPDFQVDMTGVDAEGKVRLKAEFIQE